MPPPVVAFTRPAASPTARTRAPYVRAIGASGSILIRGRTPPLRHVGRPSFPSRPDACEEAVEVFARVPLAHQADAGESRDRPRTTGTAQAKPFGATSFAEVHLDVSRFGRGHFDLCRLQVHRRHAEAEASAEARSWRRRPAPHAFAGDLRRRLQSESRRRRARPRHR